MEKNEGKLVYQFEKNSMDTIKISLHEYNGSRYVDIRTWRKFEDDSMRPMVKGVRFNSELWEEFVRGVHKVDEGLNERGMK